MDQARGGMGLRCCSAARVVGDAECEGLLNLVTWRGWQGRVGASRGAGSKLSEVVMVQRSMILRAMWLASREGFDPRNSHEVMAKKYEFLARMAMARRPK